MIKERSQKSVSDKVDQIISYIEDHLEYEEELNEELDGLKKALKTIIEELKKTDNEIKKLETNFKKEKQELESLKKTRKILLDKHETTKKELEQLERQEIKIDTKKRKAALIKIKEMEYRVIKFYKIKSKKELYSQIKNKIKEINNAKKEIDPDNFIINNIKDILGKEKFKLINQKYKPNAQRYAAYLIDIEKTLLEEGKMKKQDIIEKMDALHDFFETLYLKAKNNITKENSNKIIKNLKSKVKNIDTYIQELKNKNKNQNVKYKANYYENVINKLKSAKKEINETIEKIELRKNNKLYVSHILHNRLIPSLEKKENSKAIKAYEPARNFFKKIINGIKKLLNSLFPKVRMFKSKSGKFFEDLKQIKPKR